MSQGFFYLVPQGLTLHSLVKFIAKRDFIHALFLSTDHFVLIGYADE